MANETKIIEMAELDEIERSEDLATIREKTQEIARQIQQILLERGQMMATAESLTGGLVASHIVDIAGSSAVFAGGIVAYQNEIKEALLGVPHSVLEEKGAVSAETVLNMTEGARKKFSCQWAIATSGIAGPGGGTPDKPVGTVWVAVKCGDRIESECYHLPGTRDRVIDRTTNNVLCRLIKMLRDF